MDDETFSVFLSVIRHCKGSDLSALHRSAPPWFGQTAFVLVSPSHPGNVGAVARAMCTMGLRRLVLVAPRDPQVLAHPEAIARASGAHELLANASIAPTLAQALSPFTLAVAVSAQGREFGPQPQPPETIVAAVRNELHVSPHAAVAFVFGTERTGLSVADAAHCQLMCSIPGDPDYNSLNLAQAAQILAYCLRSVERLQPVAAESPPAPSDATRASQGIAKAAESAGVPDDASRPASIEAIEGLFGHLEDALVRIGFLDPAHPKRLMPRFRRLFGRTRLETEEVAILRGVCTQIVKLSEGNIHGPRPQRLPGKR